LESIFLLTEEIYKMAMVQRMNGMEQHLQRNGKGDKGNGHMDRLGIIAGKSTKIIHKE
jgi:hypothetical protein